MYASQIVSIKVMSSASVALDLPIHVLLSALAPLCLPWIWKQACRPFPLLHYHIQRGERGEREREEAQDWIKRKGTPSLPHPDFFIGLSIYITSVLCSVSLFPCCPRSRSQGCQLRLSRRTEGKKNGAAFYASKERDSESGKNVHGKRGCVPSDYESFSTGNEITLGLGLITHKTVPNWV